MSLQGQGGGPPEDPNIQLWLAEEARLSKKRADSRRSTAAYEARQLAIDPQFFVKKGRADRAKKAVRTAIDVAKGGHMLPHQRAAGRWRKFCHDQRKKGNTDPLYARKRPAAGGYNSSTQKVCGAQPGRERSANLSMI